MEVERENRQRGDGAENNPVTSGGHVCISMELAWAVVVIIC